MIRVPRAAWALVLAAYLLPLVFAVPLMDDDEGLHAAIAQEMVERGDWTVPRFLGQPFLDKPILYFWTEAASMSVFGRSEAAVRLPGTLIAIAGAWAIGWLVGRMVRPDVGRWAALCYATMSLPYGVSLAPLHDLLMVPLTVLAIGAFWHARHATSPAVLARWALVAGLTLGLSLLGKGLTGLGLVGIGVATWLVWTRALSWRLVVAGSAAILLAIVVAWPWYAAMERASPGYLNYFFLERHLKGLTGSAEPHAGRPFWYYLPILMAGTWPWITFALRRTRPPFSDAERLLWCWIVADVLVLSLAGSKLTTYVLPAVPAVAALAAIGIARESATGRSPRLGLWAAIVTALLPIAALIYLTQRQQTASADAASILVALTPLVVLGWSVVRSPRGSRGGASQLLSVTAGALLAAAISVLPLLAAGRSDRDLAEQFNKMGRLPRRLLIVDEGIGSFVYYLRPELRLGLTADRVRRVSRLALFADPDTDGVMVAVTAGRAAGLHELYDFPAPERASLGRYFVVPLADFRPKAPGQSR